MKKILVKSGILIQKAIDFTYPPFRKFMTPELYRYGVCGTANVLVDWILYFLVYNYGVQHRYFDMGLFVISPHILTLIIIFPVSTFSGFLLQKYVTFTASDLRGRTQLMRYFMVVGGNLLINYVGLKILVEHLHFYPTPSKMTVTILTIIFSYIGQKKFTFRT
ncbi:MAG: GtrA family protein [Tannerella sp.]|jgi:putative flippase GtrA|nr:GtrA family protein [Tannerella sp.]